MNPKQTPNYLRTAERKERSKTGRQRAAERKAAEVAAPAEVAAIPEQPRPGIGQRLQALYKSIPPGRPPIEDLRRLERACGEAGVSRSVARKIAQIYFQKGLINGN